MSFGCKGLLVLFRVGGFALAVLVEGEHQVGHLHRDARGVAALLRHARLRLLVRVGRQDGVRDGHAVVHRGPRHAARRLLGDDLEVVGLAADHAADRDQRVEVPGRRQPRQHQRHLEGAGHGDVRDVVLVDAERDEFVDAGLGERATGPLVEARLHDADPQIDAVKVGSNEVDCHGQLSRYPVTCRPKPVIEGILRGFARSFIFLTLRSRRICAPTP